MILQIPPEVKNKLEYCRIKIAEDALTRFKNQKEAAAYLGICPRALRNWIYRNPELYQFRKFKKVYDGNDKWDFFDDKQKWKTKKL